MTVDRWQRVNELFHAAIERDADERRTFLTEACSGDDALLQEIERLVAAHERADGFIPGSASAHAVRLLAGEEQSLVGRVLGRYRIEAKVGAGGMGEVYRARDEQLGRDIAIKVLPALTTGETAARARLVREARAAAALNHPHICTIHEVGEADGHVYIAMEYLEGRTLSEEIARGALTPAAVVRYGTQVAGALAHAHTRGIVHRDLKSSNVVITPDGRAKVLDFGLAKRVTGEETEQATQSLAILTRAGAILGTPPYMSPEQLCGQAAETRSDVWALGVVLHEMAAGERPFQGQSDPELIAAIMSQSPRPLPPRVPAELRAVVERCLEKEPAQRYQSAGEVRAALEAIASRTVPGQGRMSRWSVLRAARQPLPLAIGVALVAIVVLLSFNIRGLWQRLSGATPPRIESIAVLPFTSTSPGSNDQLLELGLAETLITRLSANSSLRVRSLASAQRFSGPQRDGIDAGRQLGAAYVVEGSTQRHGDRVRVNARLLTVSDGSTVWADTFDEAIDRVFTLQDGIAGAVTAALALEADAAQAQRRSPCSGDDAEAYRALLTGRYLIMRPSAARLAEAVDAFRRAIDLDPSCADAYAGMAFAYRAQAIAGDGDPREVVPLARAAARQAIAIDPNSAEAYTTQGFIEFWHNWDWTAAETSFERAIALDASFAYGHLGYAHLMVNLGRFEEALEHVRQARELDPLSPLINTLAAGFLGAANRPDAARQGIERVLALERDFWVALMVRGGMALADGDTGGAVADLSRAAEASGKTSQVLALLAMSHAAAGDSAAARAILADLESRDRAGYVPATALAAAHLGLGDTDEALGLLEQAYRERDFRVAFLKIDARWNSLRAHPRFRELSRSLGLESDRAYGRF